MIANIVDHREHRYKFRKLNVVVEATWHDNSCQDAAKAGHSTEDDGPHYDERKDILIAEAIVWGNSFVNEVTLYLYDQGKGFE